MRLNFMRARESLAHDEKTEKSFPNDYVPDSLEQSAVRITAISGRKTAISSLLVFPLGFILTAVTSEIISIL